jgi:hypothetical protein
MKLIIRFVGVALFIAGLAFMTGCVSSDSGQSAAKPADAESTIVIKPGYYADSSLEMSLTYPADLFTVENELTDDVVLFREHEMQVPTLVLRVEDIPEGITLENFAEWFKDDFKADNADSDRFKIVETNMTKLKTGHAASASLLKWRYQGAVPLYTACVATYKNDKLIIVLVTSVPGQPAADVLMQIAMLLNVEA